MKDSEHFLQIVTEVTKENSDQAAVIQAAINFLSDNYNYNRKKRGTPDSNMTDKTDDASDPDDRRKRRKL